MSKKDQNGAPKMSPKQRDVFEAWYESERVFQKAAEATGTPVKTIYDWAKKFGWHDMADDRDAKALEAREQASIKRRAKMLQRHALSGQALINRGLEFLKTRRITRAGDAITAIRVGADIERRAEGMPDFVSDILGKDDATLLKYIQAKMAEADESNTEGTGDSDSRGEAAQAADPAATEAAQSGIDADAGQAPADAASVDAAIPGDSIAGP